MTFQQWHFVFAASRAGTLYGTPLDLRPSGVWFGSPQFEVRGQECWQLFDMRDWRPVTDWVHWPARGGGLWQTAGSHFMSNHNHDIWIYCKVQKSRRTFTPFRFFTSNVTQSHGWYPVMQWEIKSLPKCSFQSLIVDTQKNCDFF